jgi:hypothetical protein
VRGIDGYPVHFRRLDMRKFLYGTLAGLILVFSLGAGLHTKEHGDF